MRRAQRSFEWRALKSPPAAERDGTVDARRRLLVLGLAFAIGLTSVFARLVQLELVWGDEARAVAAQPFERRLVLAAPRGRILARDGTILAEDKPQLALAVHYRYLQDPPQTAWLRARARRALPTERRRDRAAVAAEEARQAAELRALRARLAELGGLSLDEWNRRATHIQTQVEAIASSVRKRHEQRWLEAAAEPTPAGDSWRDKLAAWMAAPTASPQWDTIVVAEELAEHVMVENIPLSVLVAIEGQPEQWPGVRVLERQRRSYPQGDLAAHVVGYLQGPDDPAEPDRDDEPRGVRGLERRYDRVLRGQDGVLVERSDSTGRVLEAVVERPMVPGRDVTIALDASLQRTAEQLLDAALARRQQLSLAATPEPAGGAAVVLDAQTGAVLALATAPRFDGNAFLARDARAAAWLDDPATPLLNRATQMAIPPGSVFKIVTSAALLDGGGFNPRAPHECRGYLERPDRLRCALFVQQGLGHGPTDLVGALERSCNVYFFAHARELGGERLADWARRCALDAPTGIDLLEETVGQVPRPELRTPGRGAGWSLADTQALAIGQSTLTTTPLAVARLMAAVANDGRLVTPHLARGFGPRQSAETSDAPFAEQPASDHIAGLDSQALAILREGLVAAVAPPEGTAHAAFAGLPVTVAGKTGTAQVGAGREDHAWFAGYAPAERPRVVIVVALEHAGDGGTAAAPVARRIVERMIERGFISVSGAADNTAGAPVSRDVRDRTQAR